MAPPNPRSTTSDQPAARIRPRDAASLVIIDRCHRGGDVRVLMGRRHRNQVFLPNKYVFPGGRLEPGDRLVATARDLTKAEQAKLMLAVPARTTSTRMHALALTAIRETFEETGFLIGRRVPRRGTKGAKNWTKFLATGFLPDAGDLTYFARAITPPGRPRRYDTRFFWVSRQHVVDTEIETDGELSGLSWVPLSEARTYDIANITRRILDDVEHLCAVPRHSPPMETVPFYRYRRNCLFRVELSHHHGIA